MQDFHSKSIKKLYKAISLLENEGEVAAFFEDLCTIKELLDMAQRLDTAELLTKNESYQSIAGKLGVSTATICRVNKCINYGTGGYVAAINKLNGESK